MTAEEQRPAATWRPAPCLPQRANEARVVLVGPRPSPELAPNAARLVLTGRATHVPHRTDVPDKYAVTGPHSVHTASASSASATVSGHAR
jgi:hypothetical protein